MKTSRYIARVFGLVGVLFVLIVLVSGGTMLDRLVGIMSDPGFLVQAGFMNLIIGVAIVVGHNVWDGSWRVVITVVGYLALLKGVVLLAWPNVLVEMTQGMLESGMMPFHMLFSAAFYGWLTWLGFRPEKRESESAGEHEQESSTIKTEATE
jgi:hypothetical protein